MTLAATLEADWTKIAAWWKTAEPTVVSFIVPMAKIAADSIPGCPTIVGTAIGQLPSLIQAAEAIPGATGAQKSAAVQGFIQGLAGNVGSDLTGGAAKNYTTQIQPIVQKAIDLAVGLANAQAPVVSTVSAANNTTSPQQEAEQAA